MRTQNFGVCCDVSCCKHNERGCDCVLNKIRVTSGDNLKKHFCESFECRPEYEEQPEELKI